MGAVLIVRAQGSRQRNARIRAMKMRSRIASCLAMVAVAWTALWPLVSSVEARLAGGDMPLCHQAGMMVAPDAMPQSQGPEGPRRDGGTHCPLCIMAFYGAHAALPEAPQPQVTIVRLALAVERAPLLSPFESPVPPSRAPPPSLAI